MRHAPQPRSRLSGLARLAAPLLLATVCAGPVLAEDTLLAIETADGTVTELDRDTLEAMTSRDFSTETQWTWEEKKFSGPVLREVLASAGLEHGVIALVADDGYEMKIDLDADAEYLTADYPIIATRIDDAPFEVTESGPLWVMFPYDSHPELNVEKVYSMSIWQLKRIVESAE
ncbi:MAG: hypothetical protein HWE37_20925 [Rhodobacteraceae bacterium]|nr:hypothetical protein [Salipiger sp.]NVK62525.1 hypothetical protein [Paracoccaceae bacterium]